MSLALLLVVSILGSVDGYCPLSLKATQSNGLGVFAEKKFETGDVIETGKASRIDYNRVKHSILNNYLFTYDNLTSAFAFGNGMMFNHNRQRSVLIHLSLSGRDTDLLDYYASATRPIEKGEELFVSYGDGWFEERGISELSSSSDAPATPPVQRTDQCLLSSLAVSHAGGDGNTQSERSCEGELDWKRASESRVFASASISEGAVVEVCRALIMPAWHLEGTALQQRAWYAQRRNAEAHIDVGVMALLGQCGFYRPHRQTASTPINSTDEVSAPNAKYAWHPGGEGSASRGGVEGEGRGEAAQVTCSDTMAVAIVATRDIGPGEELTLPLVEDDGDRRRVLDALLPGSCIATVKNALQQYVLVKAHGT